MEGKPITIRCVVCGESEIRLITGSSKDGISHCRECLGRCQRASKLVKPRRLSPEDREQERKHKHRVAG